MELLPAVRTRMGDLHCCAVRMNMYKISRAMQIPSDFYARPIRHGDMRQEKIARHLATRENRPLPPIIAAVDGGSPAWSPVEFDADTFFGKLFRDGDVDHGLGVLALDGDHSYRVLDGRLRVAAIRSLLDGATKTVTPAGFEKEMLTVNLVFPEDPEEHAIAWPERCWELFAQLHPRARNKAAEPVSAV